MGKLVVSEFVTVDGVMEDPGGAEGFERGGWAFQFERGAEGDKFKLDEALAADALLLGRKTYEGFAAAWPSRTDEAGFADKMNSMPKFVVSTTLRDPEWSNSTVIGADLAGEVETLKEQFETILVYGSGQLVHALLQHKLVDELVLMVFPVLLGSGKRLFAEGLDRAGFDVVETTPMGQVVTLILRPAAEAS
ncbi:MAG TPA: dihydrofolate reductase family protein [Gaiellaceae bacterium]|nr:dihydrofolate reductase family protein [Gaiellaceae bacterium]